MRFAICFITTVASAQDPPNCATAAQRLHSDSPSEKAWGAHLAAECNLRGLAPAIAEQILPAFFGTERYAAALALLDALIRLDAPLDEDTLDRISQTYLFEGTILILQRPYANQARLESIRKDRAASAPGIAAANALVTMRSPGFTAKLLRELAPIHLIQVTDLEGSFPPGSPGIGFSVVPPTLTLPAGFPSIYFYRLTTQPAHSEEPFSKGSTPVYLQRSLLEPRVETKMPSQGESFCLQCLRIGFLSDLAYVPRAEVERAVEPFTSLPWSTQLDLEISQGVEKQTAAMNRLAKALLSSGALQPLDLPISLRIDVRINDSREDKSQPLQAISPFTVVLR